jgi:hypothetical protein
MIANIDAGGKRALAGSLEYEDINSGIHRAASKPLIQFAQERDIQNVQRWTFPGNSYNPFFFLDQYSHVTQSRFLG